MPCGCSGGTWTPPETEEDAADAKPGQPRTPAQQPQPVAQVGPAAPGYYHGPDR
jgi:hypothetical protein